MKDRLHWGHDKTICRAMNKDGEIVGYLMLQNVGRHVHWCWFQSYGYMMSPGCIEEVRKKQK